MEEIKNMIIQLLEGQGAIKNDLKKIDCKIEEINKKFDLE